MKSFQSRLQPTRAQRIMDTIEKVVEVVAVAALFVMVALILAL